MLKPLEAGKGEAAWPPENICVSPTGLAKASPPYSSQCVLIGALGMAHLKITRLNAVLHWPSPWRDM